MNRYFRHTDGEDRPAYILYGDAGRIHSVEKDGTAADIRRFFSSLENMERDVKHGVFEEITFAEAKPHVAIITLGVRGPDGDLVGLTETREGGPNG